MGRTDSRRLVWQHGGEDELDRGKPRTSILRCVEQRPGFGSFKALPVLGCEGRI